MLINYSEDIEYNVRGRYYQGTHFKQFSLRKWKHDKSTSAGKALTLPWKVQREPIWNSV